MTRGALVPRALLIAGRLVLGGIFIYAGYAKLREPWLQFAASLDGFKLFPTNMLEPIAKTMPWCELALGIALVSGIALRWFALLTSLVLVVFEGVLIRSYAMGLQVDCGCFGAGEALGPKTLVRDGLFLVLALVVTIGAFRMRRTGKVTSAEPSPVESHLAHPV